MSATIVLPSAPRYVATQLDNSLRITLPSRKRWLAIIPNALFVLIWIPLFVAIGGFAAWTMLASATARPVPLSGTLFLLGFFTIWFGFLAAIGATALYSLLWNLAGREVIEVSRQSIRLSRVVPGWARTREYLAEHIRDLRVSPQYVPGLYRHQMGVFGLGAAHGQMAFDYGARTIRCADADEAEIKMILAEIWQRFPQYGAAGPTGAAPGR